jgi:hypothetical protein
MTYRDIEKRRQELREHHREMFELMCSLYIFGAIVWLLMVIASAVFYFTRS